VARSGDGDRALPARLASNPLTQQPPVDERHWDGSWLEGSPAAQPFTGVPILAYPRVSYPLTPRSRGAEHFRIEGPLCGQVI
jgi:hypothetical protein